MKELNKVLALINDCNHILANHDSESFLYCDITPSMEYKVYSSNQGLQQKGDYDDTLIYVTNLYNTLNSTNTKIN